MVGIDLDNCRDPSTIQIHEPAASIIRELDSYAEISPSGTGVKLLVRAILPPKCSKVNHSFGIEVYDAGRYFTITGHILPSGPTAINERQSKVEWLLSTFVHEHHRESKKQRSRSKGDDVEIARSALAALSARRSDGYWDWLQIGMALHSVSDALLDDWDRWSGQSAKYAPGVERNGNLSTVRALASER